MVDSTDIQAGRYKAYPEYKDSGVEWLGEIPSSWDVTSVKYLAELTPKKPVKTKGLLSKECSFVPMEKLKLDKLELDVTKPIVEVFDGYTYFEDEDVLIAKVTPCFENKNMAVASNLVNGIGFGSSEIYVLRVRDNAYNRFLFYRLQENIFMSIAISNMTGAGGLRRVPADIINNYSIAIPAKSEQEKIANFLDYETAKIDTLIEKQQRLIELLTEKRQAVISHAVTTGLNPDVPMKDSGVEWLDEVPAHWTLIQLKHACELLKDGTHLPPPRVNEGIPLLSVRNVVNGKFIFRDDDSKISEQDYKQLCRSFTPKKGDVLLAIVGATLGKSAIIDEMKNFHIQRSLAIFRTYEFEVNNVFLHFLFNSKGFQSLLWENAGFSAQPGIYLGSLSNFLIPMPPLSEQIEITRFLKDKIYILDNLISKAQQAIQLMQERRTALISDAVTGKIDVRDWVKPE